KSGFTACPDLQHAGLLHVPCMDAGKAADGLVLRRLSHLGAGGDAADAEAAAVAQALADHVHVARLEDAQRQDAAREEAGIERKERDDGRAAHHPGHPRGATVQAASLPEESPRWRTSTCSSGRKRAASCSTMYTLRCWPPVQPMGTVR